MSTDERIAAEVAAEIDQMVSPDKPRGRRKHGAKVCKSGTEPKLPPSPEQALVKPKGRHRPEPDRVGEAIKEADRSRRAMLEGQGLDWQSDGVTVPGPDSES